MRFELSMMTCILYYTCIFPYTGNSSSTNFSQAAKSQADRSSYNWTNRGMTTRPGDNELTAKLAENFNEFYFQLTGPGPRQIGNYTITAELGEGAFGKVYLAQHILLNVQVVLKCGPIDDPNIVREIFYHKQLKHKHVVKLYEIIKTEQHLWMVLEYCEGNELYFYIYEKRRLDIGVIQSLFYQIVCAVQYVHLHNLCHRDLKLENILLADHRRTVIKLTDFGMVREFSPLKRNLLSTVCGTTVYMAPEMLQHEKYLGFLVDMWLLGVILYTMVFGQLPFDEDDLEQTLYQIVYQEPVYRPGASPKAVDLIKRLLVKDPKSRATLSEVLNSPLLIDIHNRYLDGRKSRKRLSRSGSSQNSPSLGRDSVTDTELVMSVSHYYTQQPLQLKIERNLLKQMAKMGINTTSLERDIVAGDVNTATAFFELALTRELKQKKKRYLKQKRKQYLEAKKSLLKSRKKVRSVLVDQTQPLERILLSLSISLNKPSSATTNTNGGFVDTMFGPSHGRSGSGGGRSFELNRAAPFLRPPLRPPLRPLLPTSQPVPLPHRSVSFHHPQPEKRRGLISSSAKTTEEQKTRGKILGKLQFWKPKNRPPELRRDSVTSTDSNHSKAGISSGGGGGNPEAPGVLPAPVPLRFTPRTISKASSIDSQLARPKKEQHDPSLNSIPISPAPAESPKAPAVLRSTLPLLSQLLLGHLESTYRLTKPRPSSMISQVLQLSQLSHLSQLSTMILELELDMMETDLSVAFDPYDDDGAYELLVNTSHVDLRSSVPLGLVGLVNGQPKSIRAVRKRPSYRRNLSLDVLIISSLTSNTIAKGGGVTGTNGVSVTGNVATGSTGQNGGVVLPSVKRSMLTRVSSTSSDDSLFDLERPVSPDPSRLRPQAIRPFKMDIEHSPRLHSPPVPAKFSALQRGQPKFTAMAVIQDESKTTPTNVRLGKLAHTSGNKIFQQGNVIEEGNEDDDDDDGEMRPPGYHRFSPNPVQNKKTALGQGNGHPMGLPNLPGGLPAELPGRGLPRDLRVP